jgi:hypothetical protein
MKRVIVVLLVIAMLFLVAANKPPKPPKIMDLEIVNRSGEEVRVSLTGLGYDFQKNEFVGGWGNIHPQFYYITVPGSIETELLNGTILTIKLPQYVKRVDVLRDLYVLDVQYAREIVPQGSNAASVMCLNTWVPPAYYGDPTYYPVKYMRQKLIIKPCNSVPVNIGAPSEGVVKYNKLNLILEFPGYYGYSWK